MRMVTHNILCNPASLTSGEVYMSKKTSEQSRISPNHQKSKVERLKAMKEALRVAAEIRRELAGRAYSDSTDLAAEDRQR